MTAPYTKQPHEYVADARQVLQAWLADSIDDSKGRRWVEGEALEVMDLEILLEKAAKALDKAKSSAILGAP